MFRNLLAKTTANVSLKANYVMRWILVSSILICGVIGPDFIRSNAVTYGVLSNWPMQLPPNVKLD